MNNIINALIRPDGSVISCVLVTVISHQGSAPRSGGSRMVVFPDRTIYGTIGGGKLEADAIANALEFWGDEINRQNPYVCEFHFSGADAASMDMICGGEVEILFEYIDPNDEIQKEILSRINNFQTQNGPGWFVLEFNPVSRSVKWGLLTHQGTWGEIGLPTEAVKEVQSFQSSKIGENILNIERLDQSGRVLIFGAGHVAQSIARICALVDFKTIVIDDRIEYANPVRFPAADKILTPASMTEVFSELSVNETTYIVIVTRGHLQDQSVVEWALKTKARYIGMIGSRRKWRLMQEALALQGFSDGDLARIHTPIGLEIGAETPEEIGVSIVAELIRCRAKNENERGK